MKRTFPPSEPDCLDEPSVPRPRAVIHAELREICRKHCSPERFEWLQKNFPLHGDQLELFK